MAEIWKNLVGFESSYEVSSKGRIRSKERYVKSVRATCGKRLVNAQIIKQFIKNNGYMSVLLQGKKGRVNVLVHRAVAIAFLPNPDNLPVVDHIDTNKTNNEVSNLRWVTHSQNVLNPITRARMNEKIKRGNDSYLHSHKNHNVHSKGATHYKAIAVVQLSKDGQFIKEFDTVSDAARAFGSNIATNISYCCNGKRVYAYGYRWMYKKDYDNQFNK